MGRGGGEGGVQMKSELSDNESDPLTMDYTGG